MTSCKRRTDNRNGRAACRPRAAAWFRASRLALTYFIAVQFVITAWAGALQSAHALAGDVPGVNPLLILCRTVPAENVDPNTSRHPVELTLLCHAANACAASACCTGAPGHAATAVPIPEGRVLALRWIDGGPALYRPASWHAMQARAPPPET